MFGIDFVLYSLRIFRSVNKIASDYASRRRMIFAGLATFSAKFLDGASFMGIAPFTASSLTHERELRFEFRRRNPLPVGDLGAVGDCILLF